MGNEKILFVDDEESILRTASLILERLGYQVKTCINPLEALTLVKSKPTNFDLIILDMTMPIMTGDQLAKKILTLRPEMPIILCTGFSDKIDADIAAEHGLKMYLEKPIDMVQLAMAVRHALDSAA